MGGGEGFWARGVGSWQDMGREGANSPAKSCKAPGCGPGSFVAKDPDFYACEGYKRFHPVPQNRRENRTLTRKNLVPKQHITQTLHGTAIYAYIDPSNHPNVGIYGIHGVSG